MKCRRRSTRVRLGATRNAPKGPKFYPRSASACATHVVVLELLPAQAIFRRGRPALPIVPVLTIRAIRVEPNSFCARGHAACGTELLGLPGLEAPCSIAYAIKG